MISSAGKAYLLLWESTARMLYPTIYRSAWQVNVCELKVSVLLKRILRSSLFHRSSIVHRPLSDVTWRGRSWWK